MGFPCENSETECSIMPDIKQHEYDLLNEIEQDPMVTQASLSQRLGIAVGSVNWYIKRLIHRGWVKVSHLDRTRLKYDLTSDGMAVVTQRAMSYARDSLKVYGNFRKKAKAAVVELQQKGIKQVVWLALKQVFAWVKHLTELLWKLLGKITRWALKNEHWR